MSYCGKETGQLTAMSGAYRSYVELEDVVFSNGYPYIVPDCVQVGNYRTELVDYIQSTGDVAAREELKDFEDKFPIGLARELTMGNYVWPGEAVDKVAADSSYTAISSLVAILANGEQAENNSNHHLS